LEHPVSGVLILTHFFRPNVGGVETHLDDLVSYLVERNYQVFVVTYQPLVTKAHAPVFERMKNLIIGILRCNSFILRPGC
jgi:hypothetical protein